MFKFEFERGLVNNFNSDLLSDWKEWNKNLKLENCTNAMNTALSELNIPLVVTPEDMSNPNLDELSSITYLSYYIKEKKEEFQRESTDWLKTKLPDEKITNFCVNISFHY
jgi:filamin